MCLLNLELEEDAHNSYRAHDCRGQGNTAAEGQQETKAGQGALNRTTCRAFSTSRRAFLDDGGRCRIQVAEECNAGKKGKATHNLPKETSGS